MLIRDRNISNTAGNNFDITIIGGGINGASLYNKLVQEGYRVLLIDKGDFASGTSQASGMMIWGGLLYLRNFLHPRGLLFHSLGVGWLQILKAYLCELACDAKDTPSTSLLLRTTHEACLLAIELDWYFPLHTSFQKV